MIENALKLVADAIGNNYTLPSGGKLISPFDGAAVKNPYFGQTPTAVKFGFGTQKELNVWLKNTKAKYPLIWLCYPLKKQYDNNPQSQETYSRARLIFAVNNTATALVETRQMTTKLILESVVEKFNSLMRASKLTKFIWIDKTSDITETFYPNYSVNEQKDGGSIDIWDAITYDCNIILRPDCVPNLT